MSLTLIGTLMGDPVLGYSFSIATADPPPWDMTELTDKREAECRIARLEAEINSLKQQLATCCVIAETSSRQAQFFAGVIDELKGASVGAWKDKQAEAAQSWIDAQKPGVS